MRICTDCKHCIKEYVLPGTGVGGKSHYYVCKISNKQVFAFGACAGYKEREESK